jgi:hypothetical protein
MNINAEFHRLVLRARWIRWSLRNHQPGDYKVPTGRHIRLSARLTAWRPTWQQRQPEPVAAAEGE